MNNSSKETIELCQFDLLSGADVKAFLTSSEEINAWLAVQPGFRYRCLSQQPEGRWADIVHWSSMTEAQQAADKFMVEHGNSPFMQSIDSDSLCMNHYDIESTQAA